MARWSKKRSTRSILGLVVAGALLLGLIGIFVNGVVSSASSSTSYLSVINQSFATQANSIFTAQEPDGQALSRLLVNMPNLTRPVLEQKHDALATSTAASAASAADTISPAPSAGIGPRFVAIVEQRAKGVKMIRSAVERLLGLTPLPPPGTGGSTPVVKPLISSSEATARLSAAGALLVKADEAVGPLRADLAKQPGHAQLERSVFLTARSLVSPSSMASLVDQLTSSSSLAVVHDLSITAVSLTPAALPTPGATSTNLPPTTRLVVTVVVANNGTVTENAIVVTASLTPVSGGFSSSSSAQGVARPGGAVSLVLPALRTKPGSTVTLTISVPPPPGQSDTSSLTRTYTVVVAPATPNFG